MVNRDQWNNMIPTRVELMHCWRKQTINRKTNKCHFRLRKCSGFSLHVALVEMEGGQGWSVCMISFQVVTYKMTRSQPSSELSREHPRPRQRAAYSKKWKARIDWLSELGKISGRNQKSAFEKYYLIETSKWRRYWGVAYTNLESEEKAGLTKFES